MVWDDGGAYALLGPSGCGKTTLLNIVSGLVDAVARARCCSTAATSPRSTPQQRNIAQVFQFPVIYDTMTRVREPRVPAAQPRLSARRDQAARGTKSPRCSR